MSEGDSDAGTADIGSRDVRAGQNGHAPLARDDVFHILQSRRRRLVLKYMQEYDGDGFAQMSDVTEHIAALEHDTTVDRLRSQQRQRVYIALYQSHLPKMDETGVIDYDKNRGHIERTEYTDSFDGYLDDESSLLSNETDVTDPDDEQTGSADVDADWHLRYLFTSGGCFFVIAAVSNGMLSNPVVSETSVGVVVATTFALLAVSHWVSKS